MSSGPSRFGCSGDLSVSAIKPSQSKPWNHLWRGKRICPSIEGGLKINCIQQNDSLLVLFDVLYATALVTQPLRWYISAKPFDKADGGTGHVLGEVYHIDALQYDIVRFHGICCSKGWAGMELWNVNLEVDFENFK